MPCCLTCGKEISFYEEKHDQVCAAGNIEIRFHFGSRHDMCFKGNERPFEAYICDDCFESEIIQQRLRKPNLVQEKLNYIEESIQKASWIGNFTVEEERLYLKEIVNMIERRKNADT